MCVSLLAHTLCNHDLLSQMTNQSSVKTEIQSELFKKTTTEKYCSNERYADLKWHNMAQLVLSPKGSSRLSSSGGSALATVADNAKCMNLTL